MSPSPAHWSWWRRHVAALVALVAMLALVADGGYQVYASRIAHRTATAVTQVKKLAPKVERLTAAQCGQTQFLYDFLNALAEDTSPSFGSPPDGAIVPGARSELIARLHAAEHASAAPLRKQGCKLRTP